MISKKLIISLLVFAVVVIGLAVVVTVWKPSGTAVNPVVTKGSQQVKIIKRTEVDPKKIPDKIPTDLPFESGATIVQNFNEQTSAGNQSTRSYETTKAMSDVLTAFDKYFKANHWTVLSTLDQPTLKMILASKDYLKLQVTISENTVTKQRLVNISATYQ